MSQKLFLRHVDLIQTVVDYVCRKQGFSEDDREDFGSIVNIRMIENDYGILREFRGQAQLKTYLVTVITRLGLDYRNQKWGKWRPSAAAKRLGDHAIRLEALLHRDGYSHEEAMEEICRTSDPSPDKTELEALAARLPVRTKRQFVGSDELETLPATSATPDQELIEQQRNQQRAEIQQAVRQALQQLTVRDRLMLRLRIEEGLNWTRIASVLGEERKVFYRRKETVLKELCRLLEAQGLRRAQIVEFLVDA